MHRFSDYMLQKNKKILRRVCHDNNKKKFYFTIKLCECDLISKQPARHVRLNRTVPVIVFCKRCIRKRDLGAPDCCAFADGGVVGRHDEWQRYTRYLIKFC